MPDVNAPGKQGADKPGGDPGLIEPPDDDEEGAEEGDEMPVHQTQNSAGMHTPAAKQYARNADGAYLPRKRRKEKAQEDDCSNDPLGALMTIKGLQ